MSTGMLFCRLLLLIAQVSSITLDIRYPQFFHPSLNDSTVQITEGKLPGSFIAFINFLNTTEFIPKDWLVNATDDDFQVISNGFSYSLLTRQTLDRERRSFYEFFIDARHVKTPFEHLFKPIRIEIVDLNDCSPTFNQSIYQVNLRSHEAHFRVQAFDLDEMNTDNSRISYSLANYQDLFRIDQTSGMIESIKSLNPTERYDLIVIARDHGKPSLSSSTLVQFQWLMSFKEQKTKTMLIFGSILAAIVVFFSLLTCLICSIHYKIKRRRSTGNEKKFGSTGSLNGCSSDVPPSTIYDAVQIFPNTFYFPLEKQTENVVHHRASPSTTTNSPVSGIDDGCYCSSDLSSDQSNHFLLLNPSTLTFTGAQQIRFEPCASFV